MRANQSIFFVEVTDTYGDEANYSWVHRFKVHASTYRGAIRKVRKAMSLPNAKQVANYGDMVRYNFVNTAICAFVGGYEDEAERLSNVTSI
jgi:hypothetical protein